MSLPYDFSANTIIDEGRTTQSAVDEIKNWLTTTSLPELPEELIVLFLLSCKNVIQATIHTINGYFKIKNSAPEMFNDRDIDRQELQKAANVVHCGHIPVRMKDNVAVNFFKFGDTNYRIFDLVPIMKMVIMTADIAQQSNPPNNMIVIVDAKGVGFMHLTCVKIWAIKKFFEYIQEAIPLKIQAIHVLNSCYVVEKILNLCKVFIKSELLANIKTHSPEIDMEQFYKDCIPASCLPKDYGGELPTTKELHQKTIEQFRELKPFFDAEEKLRSF